MRSLVLVLVLVLAGCAPQPAAVSRPAPRYSYAAPVYYEAPVRYAPRIPDYVPPPVLPFPERVPVTCIGNGAGTFARCF